MKDAEGSNTIQPLVHITARTERLIAALALISLTILGASEITSSPAIKDASETLRMALNLERHAVISIDEKPPYQPSMNREPVPIATTAAGIFLVDKALGQTDLASYYSGVRVRYLKIQNLAWLWILSISVFTAVRHFSGSFWLGLAGAALAISPFTWSMPPVLKMYIGMDSLDTDLAGAALLSAATILLIQGTTNSAGRMRCVAASVCFGVLALTKASMFYVYPAVLCVMTLYLAATSLWGRGKVSRPGNAAVSRKRVRHAAITATALTIPFVLLTLPWLTRNYADTGFFSIAERGGPVLLYRAFLDDVTPEEYLGTFSAWGNPYARKLACKLTGFCREDLEAGGRLQRLAMQFSGEAQERETQAEEHGRPDETISWYRKSRAIYNQQLAKYTAEGHRYPSGAADQATKSEAIRLIAARPVGHALLMVPLVWRGAGLTFPLLVITLIYAWKRNDTGLMLYVAPALLLVGFLAAATHFSERYGYVPAPVATVCLMFLISLAAARWFPGRGPRAQRLVAQKMIDK